MHMQKGKKDDIKRASAGLKKAIVHDPMKPHESDSYNAYHKEKNSGKKLKNAVNGKGHQKAY